MCRGTALDRFWANVEKSETCWLWTGYIKPNGYASFYPGGGRRGNRRCRTCARAVHSRRASIVRGV